MPHVYHYDSTLGSGDRAGEVIAKLAEDAYFMLVDNRVTQVPPVRNRQQDNESTSRSADIGRNRNRGELPANPNRTRASAGGPSHGGNSAGGAGGNREIIHHRDPGGGGSDSGSSNHGAGRRAGGGGDRGGRGHANSHASGASRGGFDARQKIEELRRKKSSTADDNDGFPAFSARFCNLLLPEKFKPLGITMYDTKQDPVQWLRCYTLSIENAGGNNKPHLHGSSHSRCTRLTSGTSLRNSSPATSRALWVARVLAWTWQW
jgi:hypothetical protein